jgi:hypothetical protein
MRGLLKNLGALVVAAASFALTIGFVLGLQWLVSFNLFSLMWWGVIPLGAFMTGLLAASGYYLGAVKLDLKPTWVVAVGVLVVAALVQVTLYYSQYAMARAEDGQAISEFVSFPRYVGWTLSHAKYGLIVHGYRPGGPDGGLEVGAFGYVVAVLQFLALVIGGFAIYAFLNDKPYCDPCGKYLERIMKRQLPFAGDMSVLAELRSVEAPSEQYFERLRQLPAGNSSALELDLSQCPVCKKEALVERPMFMKNGKLEYEGGAYRTTWSSSAGAFSQELAPLRAPATGAASASN